MKILSALLALCIATVSAAQTPLSQTPPFVALAARVTGAEAKLGRTLAVEDVPGLTVSTFASTAAAAAQGAALQTAGQQANNTAILNGLLAQGVRLTIGGCSRIEISSTLLFQNGSGIETPAGDKCGKGTIFMPAARFTAADRSAATHYGPTSVGLGVFGQLTAPNTPVTNVAISNVRVQSEVADNRSLIGICARVAKGLTIDGVEVTGLPLGEAINVQSSTKVDIRNAYIHDLFTNTTNATLLAGAPNVTGILIGGDASLDGSGNQIGSTGVRIQGVRIWDVETGPAFQAANGGDQSDGINDQDQVGSDLQVSQADIRRTAEPIDTFGSFGQYSDIYVEDAYNFAFKLVHGASYNVVRNLTAIRVGLAGITLTTTNLDTQGVVGNRIGNFVIVGLNAHGRFPTQGLGVQIRATSATSLQPSNNVLANGAIVMGAAGQYGWSDGSWGYGNIGTDISITGGPLAISIVDIPNDAGSVSLPGSSARFQTLGRFDQAGVTRAAVAPTTSYQPSLATTLIEMSASAASTVTIPTGWNGTVYDHNGAAASNPITISPIPAAAFTASIAGTAMTVSTVSSGVLAPGKAIAGAAANTYVVRQLTGAKGGAGSYEVFPAQTLASSSLTTTQEAFYTASGQVTSVTIAANYGALTFTSRGRGDGWMVQ